MRTFAAYGPGPEGVAISMLLANCYSSWCTSSQSGGAKPMRRRGGTHLLPLLLCTSVGTPPQLRPGRWLPFLVMIRHGGRPAPTPAGHRLSSEIDIDIFDGTSDPASIAIATLVHTSRGQRLVR